MKQIIIVSLILFGSWLSVAFGSQSADAPVSNLIDPTEVVETTEATEPTEVVETTVDITEEVEVEVTEPQYDIVINENEVVALAKMAWGEARGCSDMEIAATMWVVLNRVDAWGGTIIDAVTEPSQFHGYSPKHPVEDRIYDLAVDVLTRWQMEKQGATTDEVGRVLPPQYLYFCGDGKHNYFKDQYEYSKSNVWDWSYPNPYITEAS